MNSPNTDLHISRTLESTAMADQNPDSRTTRLPVAVDAMILATTATIPPKRCMEGHDRDRDRMLGIGHALAHPQEALQGTGHAGGPRVHVVGTAEVVLPAVLPGVLLGVGPAHHWMILKWKYWVWSARWSLKRRSRGQMLSPRDAKSRSPMHSVADGSGDQHMHGFSAAWPCVSLESRLARFNVKERFHSRSFLTSYTFDSSIFIALVSAFVGVLCSVSRHRSREHSHCIPVSMAYLCILLVRSSCIFTNYGACSCL